MLSGRSVPRFEPAEEVFLYACEVAMQGTIKRVIRDRGFGFIRAADGQEVFFHRSSLQQLNFDGIKEGESVEFEIEQGEKGLRAVAVRPASK